MTISRDDIKKLAQQHGIGVWLTKEDMLNFGEVIAKAAFEAGVAAEQEANLKEQPEGIASDQRSAGIPRFRVMDGGTWLDDDDFLFDATIKIGGDFLDEDRLKYAQWVADVLNAADVKLPKLIRRGQHAPHTNANLEENQDE
jgi:hypothetical protein